MKPILTLIFLFSFQCLFAQDKAKLQKQVIDIMTDYPTHFKNIRARDDSFHLKFEISGTDDPMVLHFHHSYYIAAQMPTPASETEAKNLFDKWVILIQSLDLNGAKLKAFPCTPDEYSVYCKQWQFDNTNHNIAPDYQHFTIQVEIIKFNSSYAATLKLGDL